MQNYIQKGERLDWTNGIGADVLSEGLVIVGSLAGVAATDIADGETGALALEGVFELTGKAEVAVTQGAALYWDADGDPYGGTAGTGCITTTATDNTYIGIAWAAAVAAASAVQVKLNA